MSKQPTWTMPRASSRARFHPVAALGSALIVAVNGCKDPEIPPPPPPKTYQVSWNGMEGKVDEAGVRIGVSGSRTRLVVSIDRGGGATYEVLGQKGTLDSVSTSIQVDLADRLAGRTWRELAEVDVGGTLIIRWPEGSHLETKLPPVNMNFGMGQLFEGAEGKPVLFGDETADPNTGDSLLWVTITPPELVGRDGKVSEIDHLAFARAAPEAKGKKTCAGYKDDRGNAGPDVTLNLKETIVDVFERRTGKRVQTRTFEPDELCPSLVTGGATQQDSMTPYEPIRQWLRSLVRVE